MKIRDTHGIQAGRARLMRACKGGDQRTIDHAYEMLTEAKIEALLEEVARLQGRTYDLEAYDHGHGEGPALAEGRGLGSGAESASSTLEDRS